MHTVPRERMRSCSFMRDSYANRFQALIALNDVVKVFTRESR